MAGLISSIRRSLDDRTTQTMKRGLTIRRIVYWSCSLTQVAAVRSSDTCAGGGNRLGRIVVPIRAGRPVLVHKLLTPKPKLRVGTSSVAASTCFVLVMKSVLVTSFKSPISFVDHVLAVHQNSSTGSGRFGREHCSFPDAILDGDKYTERFADCSRVRPKLALFSSVGFGLLMI